ncbi:MAG: extensin family protein [Myxococcales bacterium]
MASLAGADAPLLPSLSSPAASLDAAETAPEASAPVPFVISSLPVPEAPPDPARPRRFLAPASDPAGVAARTIAQRVRSFRKYRSEVPGASWSVNPEQVWSIRKEEGCLRALARDHVEATPIVRDLTTPVPTLVQLGPTPIGGVSFISAHLDRQIEISCELAARLPALARILKAHGVRSALVNSSYRDQPRTSFHTFGLALDIAAFEMSKRASVRANDMLIVAKHFEMTPDAYTCEGQPSTPEGRVMLAIACDLAKSQLFSSVLTPNYNAGHRDHFHLDLRPDDPRFFLR